MARQVLSVTPKIRQPFATRYRGHFTGVSRTYKKKGIMKTAVPDRRLTGDNAGVSLWSPDQARNSGLACPSSRHVLPA